jgi:hypothetical protein
VCISLPFFKQFECQTAMVNQHSVRRTFGHSPQRGAPDSDTMGFRPNITRATRHSNMRRVGTSANRMAWAPCQGGGAVMRLPRNRFFRLLPTPTRPKRRLVFLASARVCAPRGAAPCAWFSNRIFVSETKIFTCDFSVCVCAGMRFADDFFG